MWAIPLALVLLFGRHGAGAQPAPEHALRGTSRHCPKGKFITTHEVQDTVITKMSFSEILSAIGE